MCKKANELLRSNKYVGKRVKRYKDLIKAVGMER